MGFLKDIVLAIRLSLDKNALLQTQQQLQAAIAAGTAPATAQRNLDQIEQKIGSLEKSINRVGMALIAAFVGRVVFNFLEESAMAFARFDQKLQQSIAIMDNVSSTMRIRLGETARELAKELNIAADQVAEGYYFLASAGLSAEQSIKALPIVALFAKAGLMTMHEATEKLTLAVSALGYASKDPENNLASMTRVADVLSAIANKSQANIEQLASALNNKAAVSLRLFRKSVEEGAAALAVLADAGVRGQIAGERLDIFLRQVTSAADKHAAAFKRYGIAIFDSEHNMRSLADISADLTKALGHLNDEGVTHALTQLGIQQRTQASIKVFIGAEEALRKYQKAAEDAGGTTLRVADENMKTPIERWGQFQKKIADARMEIGEALIPALVDMGHVMGNEDDSGSIVGMLRTFAAYLKDNQAEIGGFAAIITWLATKPLMLLFDAFNMLADVLVITLQAPLVLITGTLTFFGVIATMAAQGVGDLLHALHLGSAGDTMDTFAKKLAAITAEMGKFTGGRIDNIGQAGEDFVKRFMTGVNGPDVPTRVKPRLVDAKPTGVSKRDNEVGGTDPALPDEDKNAEKRANKIEALSARLQEMIAKHTADRVDDELQKIKELEDAYSKAYKGKIPKDVLDGLRQLRASIKSEGAAEAVADVFKEEFKGGDIEDIEDFDKLRAFIDQVQRLKDAAVQGSKEWTSYNDTLEKALKLIQKLADKEKEKNDKNVKKEDDKQATEAERKLKRMETIANRVAREMSNAFSKAFEVLFTGSKRGVDAMEVLARATGAALIAPLVEYAEKRAGVDVLRAGEEIAEGLAAAADPLTAGEAAGHFEAAAKFSLQALGWAAFGGAAAGGAGALQAGGNHGNASDVGRSGVDNSTTSGTEINIILDGIDPKNPRHQQLLGDTIREFAQRDGGKITVNGR